MSKDQAQSVSQQVRTLYDDKGWKENDGITFDAKTWEDLRPVAREYLTKTRRRVLEHLPAKGDKILDMASGPIQYPEYLEYSKGFRVRVCVDLSQRALDMAREKIGTHGEFICGDFLEVDIASNSMDAAVSLHTIYHIHSSRQPAVVRKLVDIVKPGGNVVVVYSNPDNIVTKVWNLLYPFKGKPKSAAVEDDGIIYFQPQPIDWWNQFSDIAEVSVHPWRAFSTPAQKALIPSGRIGKNAFRLLNALERQMPKLFVKYGCYPMIVLTKHR